MKTLSTCEKPRLKYMGGYMPAEKVTTTSAGQSYVRTNKATYVVMEPPNGTEVFTTSSCEPPRLSVPGGYVPLVANSTGTGYKSEYYATVTVTNSATYTTSYASSQQPPQAFTATSTHQVTQTTGTNYYTQTQQASATSQSTYLTASWEGIDAYETLDPEEGWIYVDCPATCVATAGDFGDYTDSYTETNYDYNERLYTYSHVRLSAGTLVYSITQSRSSGLHSYSGSASDLDGGGFEIVPDYVVFEPEYYVGNVDVMKTASSIGTSYSTATVTTATEYLTRSDYTIYGNLTSSNSTTCASWITINQFTTTTAGYTDTCYTSAVNSEGMSSTSALTGQATTATIYNTRVSTSGTSYLTSGILLLCNSYTFDGGLDRLTYKLSVLDLRSTSRVQTYKSHTAYIGTGTTYSSKTDLTKSSVTSASGVSTSVVLYSGNYYNSAVVNTYSRYKTLTSLSSQTTGTSYLTRVSTSATQYQTAQKTTAYSGISTSGSISTISTWI